MEIEVRPARREELETVNVIRRQVNDLHAQGRPDIFKPGFAEDIRRRVVEFHEREDADVLAAVCGGEICGFAMINLVDRPETVYGYARRYYHVDEFGVDGGHRRLGAGRALVAYMKKDALRRGYDRIELDMWAFNEGAMRFYEACGFKVYRRYLEMTDLSEE